MESSGCFILSRTPFARKMLSLFSALDSHASYRHANGAPGSSQASVRLSGVRGDCDVGRLGAGARGRCLTRLFHFGRRGSIGLLMFYSCAGRFSHFICRWFFLSVAPKREIFCSLKPNRRSFSANSC